MLNPKPNNSSQLIPIPNPYGGKLWALTAMPWSRDEDLQGALIHRLRREMVDGVVVLAPCDEVRRAAGKDLLRWYRRQGFEPVHLPFAPEGIPDRASLHAALTWLQQGLRQDRHIVVHGHGETQRAALFVGAWLRCVLDRPWPWVHAWLARHFPHAELSPAQQGWLQALQAA